jgi:hypothetical protein
LIFKFAALLTSDFFSGLFGMTTVSAQDKIIVVTEGEFDAMAVH